MDTATSIESIESMDTSMDDTENSTENEATEKEKEWWLPLILARHVTLKQFEKRVGKIKVRRFFSFRNGTVVLIKLPSGRHEAANNFFAEKFMTAVNSTQQYIYNWGAKSLHSQGGQGPYEEPDSCYVPKSLVPTPNNGIVVANPCDREGKPWPTIIVEVASSESLIHAIDKVNNHWFLPNCAEDVIIIKIGDWRNRRCNNQTQRPLRRLRCLKFCRTASLQQNPNTTRFDPIEEIEFGSVHENGREDYFCSGPHMRWVTVDCSCIFSGCQPPIPSFNFVMSSAPLPRQSPSPLQRPGVAIDLYDVQQAIFLAM
ncbi:hypothetical protein C1646_738230 [Rhizophagus diaphanus]|nr:hypothetical protein C1646_738230 [Rhizophagus diaphanus] [Rhizophagus sp. MUCL 43196]